MSLLHIRVLLANVLHIFLVYTIKVKVLQYAIVPEGSCSNCVSSLGLGSDQQINQLHIFQTKVTITQKLYQSRPHDSPSNKGAKDTASWNQIVAKMIPPTFVFLLGSEIRFRFSCFLISILTALSLCVFTTYVGSVQLVFAKKLASPSTLRSRW